LPDFIFNIPAGFASHYRHDIHSAILFLTALGVPIAPQMAEAIVTAGLGIAGLVGMFTADK